MVKTKKTKRVRPKLKKPVNANKQVFDGVEFDSTPEMDMYILLTQARIPFEYIGKNKKGFTLLEDDTYKADCFERPQRRSKQMKTVSKISGVSYTPDFISDSGEWVIEVKGRRLPDFNMRWKLFKRYLNKNDNPPLLFMPVTNQDMLQVINILKEKGYVTSKKK